MDYIIVRFGGLSEDVGMGLVEVGKVYMVNKIFWEDVVRVVVECVKNLEMIGLVIDFVGGLMFVVDVVV